ncbi:HAMP domain-containing sensor histidine kinase [Pelomicrobium sp.]|uniref:HAMP domain-containing sensor histidine kinase n=1 Tax=Pelomicrobium sp. TaxID=2815319 RepID=UPI002FDCBD32
MFSRARSLLHTTALRMALRHALLQVLVLAAMLAALFVVLDRYAARQIDSALLGEAHALAALPAEHRAQSVALLTQLHGEDRRLRHYRLEDAAGRRLAGNLPRWPGSLPADGVVRRIALDLPEDEEDHDARALLPSVGLALPGGGRLLVAQAPGEIEEVREVAFGLAAAMLTLAALLAMALGMLLGWRWLSRIDAINGVAARIASGDLTQRVQSSGRGDEFDLLADHLNAMLGRIEAAVAGMREVSDHVAHDLRRPLARLKTRIEVVLRQPRDADAYRKALQETLQDSEEILATFEALLTIARLEAGSELVTKQPFDLAAVTRNVAELYAAQADESGRPFTLSSAPAVMYVAGSAALASQALAKLLDNAFKYTPPGSPIEVDLARADGQARLAVIDHGGGLSDADKARLVARFARGDSARSQPGSGLGLALAAAIARAHGGQLVLTDTAGGGLTARLDLPLAKEGASRPD